MKTLNNDWDTIEFTPTSIQEILLERAMPSEKKGSDPYNTVKPDETVTSESVKNDRSR